jgi:hypothetical protein
VAMLPRGATSLRDVIAFQNDRRARAVRRRADFGAERRPR